MKICFLDLGTIFCAGFILERVALAPELVALGACAYDAKQTYDDCVKGGEGCAPPPEGPSGE